MISPSNGGDCENVGTATPHRALSMWWAALGGRVIPSWLTQRITSQRNTLPAGQEGSKHLAANCRGCLWILRGPHSQSAWNRKLSTPNWSHGLWGHWSVLRTRKHNLFHSKINRYQAGVYEFTSVIQHPEGWDGRTVILRVAWVTE